MEGLKLLLVDSSGTVRETWDLAEEFGDLSRPLPQAALAEAILSAQRRLLEQGCPTCNGSGYQSDGYSSCPCCSGRGRLSEERVAQILRVADAIRTRRERHRED